MEKELENKPNVYVEFHLNKIKKSQSLQISKIPDNFESINSAIKTAIEIFIEKNKLIIKENTNITDITIYEMIGEDTPQYRPIAKQKKYNDDELEVEILNNNLL